MGKLRLTGTFLLMGLLVSGAQARPPAHAYEMHVCPAQPGDVDYALTRIADAAGMHKLSRDVLAYDTSSKSDRDIGRVFSNPVILIEFERISASGMTVLFVRFYRTASVDTAWSTNLREDLDGKRSDELFKSLKTLEKIMPC